MTNEHNNENTANENPETVTEQENISAEPVEETSMPSHDDTDDFIFDTCKKSRGKHYSKTSKYGYTSSDEQDIVRSQSEQRFRHRKKLSLKDSKWNERSRWQKLLIILAWIFGILLALVIQY